MNQFIFAVVGKEKGINITAKVPISLYEKIMELAKENGGMSLASTVKLLLSRGLILENQMRKNVGGKNLDDFKDNDYCSQTKGGREG